MVRTGEIVPGDVSGGTNTSHTIIVPAVTTLLNAQSLDASFEDYERAVLEDNVLSKDTEGARRRTFRYLKELYVLRPTSILFRALRDLWSDERRGAAASSWLLCVGSGRGLPSEQHGDLQLVSGGSTGVSRSGQCGG